MTEAAPCPHNAYRPAVLLLDDRLISTQFVERAEFKRRFAERAARWELGGCIGGG